MKGIEKQWVRDKTWCRRRTEKELRKRKLRKDLKGIKRIQGMKRNGRKLLISTTIENVRKSIPTNDKT